MFKPRARTKHPTFPAPQTPTLYKPENWDRVRTPSQSSSSSSSDFSIYEYKTVVYRWWEASCDIAITTSASGEISAK